jgi:chromosome segregation and condensation protein ScpB
MKFSQLITLAEAAELGLSLVEKPMAITRTKAAIGAAYLEARKRLQARDLNRGRRQARTVRRESIRLALSHEHHRVRLTHTGEWHVQQSPGSAWLLFALSDNDAENLLNT